jgi:hypothetical protein
MLKEQTTTTRQTDQGRAVTASVAMAYAQYTAIELMAIVRRFLTANISRNGRSMAIIFEKKRDKS